ncbi:RHS repeat-associated core domain-containing protein [Puniceicoccaceae bacterium K14]|nr:RHS repeat-associated core domain-containing protein [Puniceicoccaceae bacterium K14]
MSPILTFLPSSLTLRFWAFVSFCFASVLSLSAQGHMVGSTVPIDITVSAGALSGTFKATFHGDSGDTILSKTVTSTTVEESDVVFMKTGVEYDLTLWKSSFAANAKVRLSAPPGWQLYIATAGSSDLIVRQSYLLNVSNVNTDLIVKILPSGATQSSLAAGLSTSLSHEGIIWSVGMGSLSNGDSAGVIQLRAASMADMTYEPADLFYSAPSPEVDYYAPNGVLRQVFSPQTLADIVDTGNNKYEIRFYDWTQVGSKVNNLYTTSGNPYVTYEINESYDEEIRIKKTIGSTSWYTLLAYTGNYWTLYDWTEGGNETSQCLRKVTTSISYSGSWKYVLVTEYGRNSSGGYDSSSKTRYTYRNFDWGYEVTRVEKGYGESYAYDIDYVYFEDEDYDAPGEYTRLHRVTQPDGGSTYYYYFTDFAKRGLMRLKNEPFQDYNYGRKTEYTYELDITGNSYVIDEVKSYLRNGSGSSYVQVGRITYDYTARTINGFAARETKVRQYADASNYLETKAVHYREDISGNDPSGQNTGFFRRGQPYSIKRPDGTQTSYAYIYYASADVYSREAIEGLTANPAGSDDFYMATYSSTEDIENIYVVNERNTKRHWNVKGGGLVYGIYDSVADNNGFELMREELHTYDSTSRLYLTRERAWKSNSSAESTWNTLFEASYSDLRPDWTEDRTGARIDYLAYDKQGRVEETIENGGDTSIADIHRMYAYDGSNRTVEQYKMESGSSPETIPSTWNYDLAGRLSSKTLDCCKTVNYEYNPSAGTVKTINSDQGYVLDTYYRDGSLDYRSGDASAPLYVRSQVAFSMLETWTALANFSISTKTDGWRIARSDWLGRSVEIEEPTFDGGTARTTEFEYNSKGQLAARFTKSGSSHLVAPYRYQYDAHGSLQFEGLDIGNSGTLTTSGNDRITKMVHGLSEDSSGHWWSISEVYAYPSSSAVLVSKTESRLVPLANTMGEVVTTDQYGNKSTTTTTLDRSKDKVTTTTSFIPSLSNDEISVYQNGLLKSSTDTAGTVSSYTYDALRRLKSVNSRDDVTKLYDYVTGSNRLWNVYEVVPSSQGGGNRKILVHDYDTDGRLEEIVRRNKHGSASVIEEKTTYAYNKMGQRTSISNASGDNGDFPVYHYYDAYGRLEKTEQLRGGGNESEVRYEYDSKTNLLKYKKHYKSSSTYDTETYSYNDLGAMSRVTYPNSKYIDYSYAINSVSYAGDLTGVSYSDSTPSVTYSSYDRLGRATQVADATGTRTFTYAANNGLSLSKEDLDNSFYGSGNDINRFYETDEDDEIEGRYRGFAYDGKDWIIGYSSTTGRISSIKGEVENFGARRFDYAYDDYHVHTVTHGSYQHIREYESWRENLNAVHTKWGSSYRSEFDVSAFSWAGQIDSATLAYNSNSLAAKYGSSSNIAYSYTYDARSQLTQYDSSYGSVADAVYTYDSAGNRKSSNDVNGYKSYGANRLNQLTGHSLAYDSAGNQIDDASWDYTYDAGNRLTRMWGKTGSKKVLTFKYDYKGRRVEKKVWNSEISYLLSQNPNTHIKFVYDGMSLVAEIDGVSENLRKSFYWGLDKSNSIGGFGGAMGLLMIQDWTTNANYYPSFDLNGNLVALHDESGNWAAWYEYDPFGNVVQSGGSYADENPIGFSSQYTDRETGQVYYGFRYYDPKLGRFGKRDPIGEQGGLNLYRFVNNNPVNSIDIHGLYELLDDEEAYELAPLEVSMGDDDPGYQDWLDWNDLLDSYTLEDILDDILEDSLEVVEDSFDGGAGSGSGPGDKDQKDNSERCAELTNQIASQGGLRNLIERDIAGFEGRDPTELSLFTGASLGALTTGVAFETLNQLDILPAQATYSFIDAGSRGLGPITELTGYGNIAIGISGVGIGIDALSTGNSLMNGDYSGAARSAVSGTVGTFVLRSALKEALTKGAGSSVFTPFVGIATGLASFGGDLVIHNEQNKINQSAFELASKINGIQLKQRAKLDQSITSATKEFNELGCGD